MTSGAGDDLRGTRNSGGVQSIERVFELLETMADARVPGVARRELAVDGLELAVEPRIVVVAESAGQLGHGRPPPCESAGPERPSGVSILQCRYQFLLDGNPVAATGPVLAREPLCFPYTGI